MTGPAVCAEGRFAVPVECCGTTFSPTRSVLLRTVPAFGQEGRNLAEGHQRRIPGRHVGQLWCDRILAEVQGGEALRLTRALTGADEQPADAHRHIAEQGTKLCPIVALAGQHAPTGPRTRDGARPRRPPAPRPSRPG